MCTRVMCVISHARLTFVAPVTLMTSILDLDLDILKMYPHVEKEVCRWRQQDRERQTDATERITTRHSGMVTTKTGA